MPRPWILAGCLLLLLTLLSPAVAAAEPAPAEAPAKVEPQPTEAPTAEPLPERIAPADWLLLPRVGDYRRAALHIDPIEAAVARGEWTAPTAGTEVPAAIGGEAAWRVEETPRSADLAGGYAYAEFESPAAGVLLLEAAGCAAVCLNGEWLPGDPYGYGWFRPPAQVAEGKNWVLVHLARPGAKPRLVRPTEPVTLVATAATLPDLVVGEPKAVAKQAKLWGSIPLQNASEESLADAELRLRWGDGEPTATPLRTIAPRLITPITFELPAPPEGLGAGAPRTLRVEVVRREGEAESIAIAGVELSLRVVTPTESRVETFLSGIDGSVQAYAFRPATAPRKGAGLLVALHDAGQTATECLAGYRPRADAAVLAPSGRGKWAFDWEKWSGQDAIEAMEAFQARRREEGQSVDPEAVALTGRGMGGHGALSLATLYPDRFAAVGVADGWISLFTQGGAVATPLDAGPMERLLGRQASADDPLQALTNLAGMGVSVLHTGSARVPVEESRYLRERLGEFHRDFVYREPAAGEATEPLLVEQRDWITGRRRPSPAGADRLEFSTPRVGTLATLGWATILGPDVEGGVAGVRLRRDPARREVFGTTDNVRRLRLSFTDWRVEGDGALVRVRLDGGSWIEFTPGRDGDALALARDAEGVWRQVPDVSRGAMNRFAGLFKGPDRPGGFDSVFCCRPLLVYGTRGSEEEQRWAAAKARYDAHLFLYRGAGRLEVAADKTLVAAQRSKTSTGEASRLRDPRRSLVLYGNRTTNSAWSALLREAFQRRRRAIRLESGQARVGRRPESGEDLAVLAVRPRAGNATASVGVVGGTGVVGMRMTTRLRYFWSGVAYPDLLIFGPQSLAPGGGASPADDVRAAGYFDSDWGVDSGGVVWRDPSI